MKKLVLLTILTTFSLILDAKSIVSVKKTLKNRDFLAFSKAIDSFNLTWTDGSADWWRRQELLPGFEAAIIYVTERFPVKDDPESWNSCEYRIHLIATKSEIVYYDFIEAVYSSVLDSNEDLTTGSFRNRHLIDSMRSEYFNIYHTWPEESDMFEYRNDVFGLYCDEGGSRPASRVILDSLLAAKDYASIDKWLRSANVTHQLYAVDGLYQLEKEGYVIKPGQLEIINAIRQKNGTVLICDGCLHDKAAIRDVVDSIVSERNTR